MSPPEPVMRSTVEAVWRIEAPRLIGGLARFLRDVDRAEDFAQDALLAALERWPTSGVPENPGAWLMSVAKNRAVDEGRRRAAADVKYARHVRASTPWTTLDADAADQDVGDDVLRLLLITCHPILSEDARTVLTLRLVAGLTAAEIARAFLTSEATIAQRLVRAKRTLAAANASFEIPVGEELKARVPPTLKVIYLIFNEGYAATAGEDWLRPELCEEAMRLGRILVGLGPDEAEAHGLLALMELQASRLPSRVGPNGEPVLLAQQDRSRWDRFLITRGLAALKRAESLRRPLGPYAVQAAIAACHATALRAEDVDWPRIVALYDALLEQTESPVVALNRAVAVSMAYGAAEGLSLVDELSDEAALRGYHLLSAVRGDLLFRLGRSAEAKVEFEKAAAMTTNARERDLLRARAANGSSDVAPPS